MVANIKGNPFSEWLLSAMRWTQHDVRDAHT